MSKVNPVTELRRRLKGRSQKELCAEFGISESYLSDVLHGRREAGPQILEPLGLERTTVYFRRAVAQDVSQP